MKYKRIIAAISDTHTFGRYGLNPPKLWADEGFGISSHESPSSLALWNAWTDFCKICDEENVDTVIHLGDAMHGQNPIERGTMLLSPNMSEQKAACRLVLTPMVYGVAGNLKRKFFMISGSGYHQSGKGDSPERDVCESMGGTWLGPLANVKFEPCPKIFNLQHGASAAYIYREMLMGREALFMKWAEAMGKIPKISCVIRGHWHWFAYMHNNRMHTLQLPGWMMYEPSKPYLKSYGKMQADIGGCIIWIDENDRIRIWHYLYDIPPMVGQVQEV